MQILSKSLFHIDLEKNAINLREIDNIDANNYIEILANEILNSDIHKKYKIRNENTQVIKSIILMSKSSDSDEFYQIANRLLDVEMRTQANIEHLGTKIRKGSLIQALFDMNNEKYFLISKIDSDKYLDEASLKERSGLRYSDKAYKNCIVKINPNEEIGYIYILESQSRTTKYWYDDFLELTEVRSNKYNTKSTFDIIENILKRKFKDNKSDLTMYRNQLLGYFKNNEHYEMNKCLEHVFGDIDNDENLIKVKGKIIEASKTNELDTQFKIESDAINKRKWKEKKVVNEAIDLLIKDPIENIENTIETYTEAGRKYLKIEVTDEDTYQSFNWKNNEKN